MYEIIECKKNKLELSKEQIEFFVKNYTENKIPDYQMASLLMAIQLNGMTDIETYNLTMAMVNSGDIINLNIDKAVDKHSTGGIGDKTTLVIAPIVACLNCKVAKMSGRGLGFTGGTIDKLESIEGFNVNLTQEEFLKQVNDIGISIISQTTNIAPADKKIYALRDVTCTVESIPLIASSIMSKKIAGGAKKLVIDVKVGSGAFMKDIESATLLAQQMIKIGKSADIKMKVILTDMNSPLGNNIGNKLEVIEAIEVLKGKNNDLREECIIIATLMNSLVNNIDYEKSKKEVLEVLESGQAYNKFLQLIQYQGGNIESVYDTPKYKCEVYSNQKGYIKSFNCEVIGKVSLELGSGRKNKDDTIDYTAGIIINKKIGDYVDNDLLCTLYSSKINDFEKLKNMYLNSISFSTEKVFVKDKLIKIVD